MERLERDSAAAKARGQAPATPVRSQPWNSVWVAAVDDTKFLAPSVRGAGTTDPHTCRASFGRYHKARHQSNALILHSQSRRPAGSDNGKRRRIERPRTEFTKVHREANGVYTHNRCGIPLCSDFQTGACAASTRGSTCPRNGNTSHQCNKCLGDGHGGASCSLTPREPNYGFGKGKKGKGKGKRSA